MFRCSVKDQNLPDDAEFGDVRKKVGARCSLRARRQLIQRQTSRENDFVESHQFLIIQQDLVAYWEEVSLQSPSMKILGT